MGISLQDFITTFSGKETERSDKVEAIIEPYTKIVRMTNKYLLFFFEVNMLDRNEVSKSKGPTKHPMQSKRARNGPASRFPYVFRRINAIFS